MTLGDFTEQADAYTKARPGYPRELVDSLAADIGGNSKSHLIRVADVGAGTGIMTTLLSKRGFNVTAVEPNTAMRREAFESDVTWVEGTFEDTQLSTEEFDWVVAAQAFHWADPPRALPELRRILKPNGVLTLIWNNRLNDKSPLLTWTQNAIRNHVPDFDVNYRCKSWDTVATSTGDFTFVSRQAIRHSVTMTKQKYLNLWRSLNRLRTVAGSDRFGAFLRDVGDHLEATVDETIEVPYECEAWSFRAAGRT